MSLRHVLLVRNAAPFIPSGRYPIVSHTSARYPRYSARTLPRTGSWKVLERFRPTARLLQATSQIYRLVIQHPHHSNAVLCRAPPLGRSSQLAGARVPCDGSTAYTCTRVNWPHFPPVIDLISRVSTSFCTQQVGALACALPSGKPAHPLAFRPSQPPPACAHIMCCLFPFFTNPSHPQHPSISLPPTTHSFSISFSS